MTGVQTCALPIFIKHAFRNSFIPIASTLGSLISLIVAGSMLVEKVFDIQGFGMLSYQALMDKDYALIMGTLLLTSFLVVLGYLLKCYKFHKQGFGEAWDKGMHEAFALLKNGQLGKRPFRLRDLPNYVLMELWMIWNMVPYLWYRLVVVRFDLK